MGKFHQSGHFILRVLESGRDVKMAVSVSKKVSKSAVTRNTLRRRTYAVIKGMIPSLHRGAYLLSAKPRLGAEKTRGEVLRKELSLLLKPFERG